MAYCVSVKSLHSRAVIKRNGMNFRNQVQVWVTSIAIGCSAAGHGHPEDAFLVDDIIHNLQFVVTITPWNIFGTPQMKKRTASALWSSNVVWWVKSRRFFWGFGNDVHIGDISTVTGCFALCCRTTERPLKAPTLSQNGVGEFSWGSGGLFWRLAIMQCRCGAFMNLFRS